MRRPTLVVGATLENADARDERVQLVLSQVSVRGHQRAQLVRDSAVADYGCDLGVGARGEQPVREIARWRAE